MLVWKIFVPAFAISALLLRTIFYNELVIAVGVCIVAWFVADLITKTLLNNAPRKLLQPTNNKAVFVTGCDSGFGHELAKRLDGLGFTVYAGCLVPDGDGALELKEICSDQLHIVPLDVTKDEVVAKAAQFVKDTLDGRDLWAVVNNAGIAVFTEIEWCSVDVYEKILNVNALGPIRVTKAFLPLLRQSHGRVVIVASLAGRYTFPGFSAYSMSKHASVSFGDGLRREMKKWGISVHLIEPTLYKTPIAANEVLKSNLKKAWDSTPIHIQESYGEEYFNAFQDTLQRMTQTAKGNINEVVEDMVDAVAGQTPKTRYVPSTVVQMRAKLLSSVSTEMQDFILSKTEPNCAPAAAPMPINNNLDKPANQMLNRLKKQLRRTQSEPPGTKNKSMTGKID